mgnify:CR=1 FL=1
MEKEVLKFSNEDNILSIKCGHENPWSTKTSYTMDLNGEKYVIKSKLTKMYNGVKLDENDNRFHPALKKEDSPYFYMGLRGENGENVMNLIFKDSFYIEFYAAYDESLHLIPEEKISEELRKWVKIGNPESELLKKEEITVYDVVPSFYKKFKKINDFMRTEFIDDRILSDYLASKGHTVLFKINK